MQIDGKWNGAEASVHMMDGKGSGGPMFSIPLRRDCCGENHSDPTEHH
jgi:hypothetical protein